ncbi:ammonium transporter [Luethyella okanaganae]|uniref:Ammonium transporter n=1 Tax=Luethyella okanaganae TaxID=69372 RepID=A0ABW1VD48_9MICO
MDQGNTAFVLICAALVLLMTPGLAFFYGGLVKAKSVVSMMMMSFGALAIVAVLWVLYGYAIVFGDGGVVGWFGWDPSLFGLDGLLPDSAKPAGTSPAIAFAAFQAMFAIVTVALVSGAIADRARFGAWMIFAGVWATLVYLPVAYWVFNLDDGWLVAGLGVYDFAGGLVVHINAGAAALALAFVFGSRTDRREDVSKPHAVPFVLLGASLLWFGWFGLNAGSETVADGIAALVFINTVAAPAAAVLAWLVVEKINHGGATAVGAASGAVAGLVAITPAGNMLTPFWAIVLGFVAGAACAIVVTVTSGHRAGGAREVVGIHLVGGLVGTLFIGLLGTDVGGLITGDWTQLGKQALGAAIVLVYSFTVTLLIGFTIEKTMGFRGRGDGDVFD